MENNVKEVPRELSEAEQMEADLAEIYESDWLEEQQAMMSQRITVRETIEGIFASYACDYDIIGERFYRVPHYGGLSAATLEEFEDNLRDFAANVGVITEKDGSLTLVVDVSNGDDEAAPSSWSM
ncbi:hypothetical protein [Streptococcus thoraltensis]|uniref:hypothetical protein n=1 Tax=Streptococcus thoraltensis TaxID=55085 RepID=UPI001F560F83|nr:hypothetical protein [Streptococcus thoraltensis]